MLIAPLTIMNTAKPYATLSTGVTTYIQMFSNSWSDINRYWMVCVSAPLIEARRRLMSVSARSSAGTMLTLSASQPKAYQA